MQYIKSWVPTGVKKYFGLGTITFGQFKRLTGEVAKLNNTSSPRYQKQVSRWQFESENFCMYQAELTPCFVRLVLVTRMVAEASTEQNIS